MESVNADEIMVVQAPFSGELTWYTTPGVKWQGFGKVTTYPRRSFYKFEIPVRFNDGGHATMKGSIQYEMPLDIEHLTALHVRFGNSEAIQKQLIETVTNKSVYMTGPLMSSKESYAEKRNTLIHCVEDQVDGGVYKTTQRDVRIKDPITGVEKTGMLVEIVTDASGVIQRQEEAVLTSFGIRPFNFSITEMPYDEAVEAQIKQQQQITMDVQTSIADAKKAEQRAITVAEQGKASAAEAKWQQEVVKAKEITQAEQQASVAKIDAQKEFDVATLQAKQRLEVARTDAAAAGQRKIEQTLLGEGEAARRRLVMEADGALEKKLEAFVRINEAYAKAMSDYRGSWVPGVVMGSNGSNQIGAAGSGATDFVQLLTVKAARDLALDLSFSNSAVNRVTEK
ncbi:MAG: hypothetical protein HYT47_00875 [Candidatus Vogelbacteria bacterium]|nr:hypothetical protein [Candidatus Vogelbacteria bacterium]